MNNQLDYAEMLEIPVNTLNVVRKKSKRKKQPESLKDKVIEKVNDKMVLDSESDSEIYSQTMIDSNEPYVEDTETAVEKSTKTKKPREKFFNEKTKIGKIVIVEFAVCCALACTIFLTNMFMPSSAINTYLKGLFGGNTLTDTRTYSEFTLNNILTDENIDISASQGVLSFKAEASVYPACDGKVSAITKDNGTYTVEINYSKNFSAVFKNLNTVYYEVGSKCYANLPLGYSEGESAVNVMFYGGDDLLSCYSVSEDNSIIWTV